MPAPVTLLPARDYRRERWHNQQGWTREILRTPDADAFDWRASIAEITHDTLFSPYPGYHRAQVLLQGSMLQLGFVDGRRLQLEPPHQQVQFDGAQVAACHLPSGPVHVFNAIWNPTRVALQLLHRPLVGPMLFLPQPGVEWLVHLLGGLACLRGDHGCQLDPGDSLLLRPAAGDRMLLEGSGEALLLRVADQPAQPGPGASSLLTAPPPAPPPAT